MITLVISGGQTGVDQAAWRAARRTGIRTAGWMPLGFRTEDGLRPEFQSLYNAQEHASADYRARTRANVRWAQATLWLGRTDTPGHKATASACDLERRDLVIVRPGDGSTPRAIAHILSILNVRTLNVAGHRESLFPGISARAEAFLVRVFRSI